MSEPCKDRSTPVYGYSRSTQTITHSSDNIIWVLSVFQRDVQVAVEWQDINMDSGTAGLSPWHTCSLGAVEPTVQPMDIQGTSSPHKYWVE